MLMFGLTSLTELMVKMMSSVFAELGLTFSSAESITGGRIQAEFTSKSGSSAYFMGGVCAYSLDAKVEILGCDRLVAKACNCVSQEIANQMAEGAQKIFKTDVAIATTGYVEPFEYEGETKTPVVFIAVKVFGETYGEYFAPQGTDRDDKLRFVTERTLAFALEKVGSHNQQS